MANFDLDYADLNIADRWECTYKIHGASLDVCCEAMNIQLNHHEALSDARACAMLYLKNGY